jgi:hypothetical protein
MNIFEGLNIFISTFCVCSDGFPGLSKAFHPPIIFVFASLKSFTNIENASLKSFTNIENASWGSSKFPSLLLVDVFLVPTSHWLQGKGPRINLSKAASRMIFQKQSRLPVCIFSIKSPLWGL